MSFTNFGWGTLPENPVVVSTSSSATGAPVYAATPSTPTSAVFNAIVGSPTVLVTAAPSGGGDISLQTINMVTTNTNQNITGRKTFATLPPIIPTITADGINNITVPTTAGTMALTSQITSLVTGPGSAVSGNIATYNGTTGKLIQDSGVATTNIPNQLVNTTSSPTFVGVTLQTTGGTPALLDYCEDVTFNLTFTGPFTKAVSCRVIRIGKMVNFNMSWTTNQASAGGFFTTNSLPARFVPSIAVDCQIWVTDNSVAQTTPGRIVIIGTNISVYKQVATNFTAAGLASFNNWSWTWAVA